MQKLLATLLAIFLMLPGLAMAQEVEAALTDEVIQELVPLRHQAEAVVELEGAGIIAPAQKEAGVQYFTTKASDVAGQELSLADLLTIDAAWVDAAPTDLSVGQRILGFMTFTNILMVLGSIGAVICFFVFFGEALAHLILAIPKQVWEGSFYVLSVGLMFYGATLGEALSNYVGLTAGIFFAASVAFSFGTRRDSRMKNVSAVFFTILCIALFPLALAYNSALIAGVLAIPALMGLMGFTVMMWPGVVGIGFDSEDAVPRGTFAGLAILAIFVASRAGLVNIYPDFQIFETGSLYWGSFVGYLGLLILSSKLYGKDAWLFFNGLTLVMGFAALLLGSVLAIPELQKIGGTFFVLWACEKYFEVPAKSIQGYAFMGMIFFGLMWAGSAFLKTHPELAATYLLF